MIFGGIPGLEKVVVELQLVDRGDRDFRIGVSGQQDALGFWKDRAGLLEELQAGHLRHALIREEQGRGLVALLQLSQEFQGRRARGSFHDPIFLAEFRVHVAFDRVQNRLIVVDDHDHRMGHDSCL